MVSEKGFNQTQVLKGGYIHIYVHMATLSITIIPTVGVGILPRDIPCGLLWLVLCSVSWQFMQPIRRWSKDILPSKKLKTHKGNKINQIDLILYSVISRCWHFFPYRALYLSLPLTVILSTVVCLVGLVIYATYHECDPFLLGQVRARDQVSESDCFCVFFNIRSRIFHEYWEDTIVCGGLP